MSTPKRKAPKKRREAPGRPAIADAARALFAKRGYGATTIEAIAEAAGYAVPTVYFHFGSKAAIVSYLVDRMLEDTIMPTFKASMESEDPRRVLELTAHISRSTLEKWSDIYSLLRSAAQSDQALSKLYAETESGRLYGQRRVAELLQRRGHLAKGVNAEKAVGILWALASQETYQRLVIERGWTQDAHESWLASCLKRELLGSKN